MIKNSKSINFCENDQKTAKNAKVSALKVLFN